MRVVIRCDTCGRSTWRPSPMVNPPGQLIWCCMGPGDPWLLGQAEEDRDRFIERTGRVARGEPWE